MQRNIPRPYRKNGILTGSQTFWTLYNHPCPTLIPQGPGVAGSSTPQTEGVSVRVTHGERRKGLGPKAHPVAAPLTAVTSRHQLGQRCSLLPDAVEEFSKLKR